MSSSFYIEHRPALTLSEQERQKDRRMEPQKPVERRENRTLLSLLRRVATLPLAGANLGGHFALPVVMALVDSRSSARVMGRDEES